MPSPTKTTVALGLAACGVLLAGAWGAQLLRHAPAAHKARAPMLLVPMIGLNEPCLIPAKAPADPSQALEAACTGPQGSASALVESTLHSLQPHGDHLGPYPLGYTLAVPLLQLFEPTPQGGWAINQALAERFARTIADTPRPLILYLFSTHFDGGSALEKELAQDPTNLAHTQDGPLPPSPYYSAFTYAWSFASTANAITQRRAQAVQALLGEVCRLPAAQRSKIRGVTLLGELHHLFPDFQSGMGYAPPYRITDYSAASVQGFRDWLRAQYRSVAELNRAIGGDYASFDAISPPAHGLGSAPPTARWSDHIDPFAHGVMPLSGWAWTPGATQAQPARVHIYRNGRPIGQSEVTLGRQDVLAALPELGTANTGWQFDLDFTALAPGPHRIDLLLQASSGTLSHWGTRTITIAQRGDPPGVQRPLPPQHPLPATVALPAGFKGHIDQPADHAIYRYNPLAALWHAFRGQQVVRYLRYFDQLVAGTCLADTPRYTHQIIPFTNPGWDTTKFAIDASLHDTGPVRLGVSLYGAPTYGDAFLQWYTHSPRQRYGVTEFHPLKALSAAQMERALDLHARHGADFVSFFLEPRWQGALLPREHNLFSFDPDNAQFGSDALYQAVQQLGR